MIALRPNGTKHSIGEINPNMIENNEFLDNQGTFYKLAFFIQLKFRDFIVNITHSENTIFSNKDVEEIDILENLQKAASSDISVNNFALVKYYLEKLFYEMTETGVLEFCYRSNYLVSSKELGEKMGVSRATIKRYVDNGMETVNKKGIGHKHYPKHNAFYWKDSVWALRIQALQQNFKLRDQSKTNLIEEIKKEIQEYEKQYGGPFNKVFADVVNGKLDIYDLDEPDDYKDWRDLLNDLEKVQGNNL
ncbi:HTH domain-containing protein [Rummeliibacillus suwonensis]|uniref:HTH domain-containing protein n=1 Tax=Rummeliibacillus suwonensis TaxID=1306154 RepID=UPI0028A2A2B3|nr:HTH domain-containing protein [Rummeliibacillus suwonensis]